MKRVLFFMCAVLLMTLGKVNAKTLIVYYSFTNNVHTIVSDLKGQIDADVVRIEPAEKGIDYAANNYAAGSALISAIRNAPNDPASYPDIDLVDVDLSNYNVVIVAAPLWWSNMAAPLQSFLFKYGNQMSGKKIGLIVSSASSGISNVVADAKRLIPDGAFIEPNLWIRSSQTSSCHNMIAQWLKDIDYSTISAGVMAVDYANDVKVTINASGVRVIGEFDELTVFDANGHKLLEGKREFTPFGFVPGCYVANIRKGTAVLTRKKLVVR